MVRKPLIAGNWKMNLNHFEAIVVRDCVAAQTAVRKRQALAVMKTAMEIDVRDARSIRA